jgi:hypothetical protein
MNLTRETRMVEPPWCDAVMRALPEMYRRGDVNGVDHSGFIYAVTFFSVQEEVRRGASQRAVREQRSRVLRSIDRTDRSDYDKEQFAGPFSRAVDDALAGRSPCVLQSPESPEVGAGL